MDLQKLRDMSYKVTHNGDGGVQVTGPPLTEELRQTIAESKPDLLKELEEELWDEAVAEWEEHDDRIPDIVQALEDTSYGYALHPKSVRYVLGFEPTPQQLNKATWQVYQSRREKKRQQDIEATRRLIELDGPGILYPQGCECCRERH